MAAPLKIQQLRQFVIAARNQSFRVAALETHRSQAAITLAMRALQEEAGGQLFEDGHQARLTPLGQALLPLLTELITVHDRVQNEMRRIVRGEQGSVTLSLMPSLAEEWLPGILRRYRQAHPGVKIHAADVSSPRVAEMVESGLAELGVAGLATPNVLLRATPVARDTFGVVCRPDHRIAAAGKSVPWKALRDETLISNTTFHALQGHDLGRWLETPDLVLQNRGSLIAAVQAGLGITVLPTLARPPASHGLAFVPLTAPRVTRIIGTLRRAEQSLLPAAVHMHELMLKSLAEFARARGATSLI
ncbi:LysR family transcriptional regulator [Bordetella sp. H567]|uniref:LysR family transcriptional regulator n=1 Tax=Bordetella sp. H567 TaxID=1697043 RepID=UPI00081C42B5|nr:LysR substrate-binding domain-containing protein [Bordetella sp. H567]AOB31457.1 LysR family transcriptional regulator [Bordetella sp. H567]